MHPVVISVEEKWLLRSVSGNEVSGLCAEPESVDKDPAINCSLGGFLQSRGKFLSIAEDYENIAALAGVYENACAR